jgi:hypothetical protein
MTREVVREVGVAGDVAQNTYAGEETAVTWVDGRRGELTEAR